MSIADKLQVLAENEQRISNEVGDQADLIAQISSVIDEKLAGGGGEEPVNKLASVVDGSVTELTAEDLAGATSIVAYKFRGCRSLTSIVIPDSVAVIGNYAFYNCYELKRVVFSNPTKVAQLDNKNAFTSTHADLQFKVPSNLIDEWKTATNWSSYADKIVTEFTNEV